MKPYQPAIEKRVACVQGIVDASVAFLNEAITHQIEEYRGNERLALEAVLNRYKGVMPPDLTDSAMLNGFKLIYEDPWKEMIRIAVLKYPEKHQETMRRVLLYKEPEPEAAQEENYALPPPPHGRINGRRNTSPQRKQSL